MRTPAAVVYLCTADDTASRQLYINWCTNRATVEDLPVSEVITDHDELVPAVERAGWQRVTELAAAGSVAAVVTVIRSMVAPDFRTWRRLADRLAEQGVTLLTMRPPGKALRDGDDLTILGAQL
ncbi:hypothetical protein AB0A71_31090 [Kitasatospora aureofaciens]|uniref:hypothetical protein n=1 Tax=Kitasatospora aureofaciens TaxID=1894 RepID=UPI0033D9C2CB